MTDVGGTWSPEAIASRKPSSSDVDVFLNFHGPDTRSLVARVIYEAFLRAGVRVYSSDESTRQGTILPGELMEAITNSSIYIPIFSKDYASSTWCLRELEKIMECWEASQRQEEKKTILPIFHGVDISEAIKLKWGVYINALQKHKEVLGEAVVNPWEIALQKAVKIEGLDTRQHGLWEIKKHMMEKVCCKLWARNDPKKVSDDFVGMEDPMKDIMKLLDLEAHDVRFVTIHGIRGVGKTTLARLIFDKISDNFKSRVAFLSEISEEYRTAGIENLQKNLISQLLQVNSCDPSGADQGVEMIRNALKEYGRVLIVLDDLDSSDQLLNLAGELSWFDMGSRIIITTRDIGIIPQGEGFYSYKMQLMRSDDATKLFSQRVFERDSPPEEYGQFSRKVVETIGRHPLTVGVIAPFIKYEIALQHFQKEVSNIEAEATTSGLPSSRHFEVFLNFRGPDSRATIVDVLYDALVRAGVRVFFDDESIRQEDIIGEELMEAISNSKVYIPIFSRDYASSRSCLRELEKIMECWDASQKQVEKIILPIFVDVNVSSDVKLKWEVYTTALQKHKDALGVDVVKPWEVALQKAAKFKGFHISDHGLLELVKLIAEEVCHNLWTKSDTEKVPDDIGMDHPMEDIMELLDLNDLDVRCIAIHGIGGIGKTTLARLVYNQISFKFNGEAAFLSDIRNKCHMAGIVTLQKELVSQLPLARYAIYETSDRAKSQRVLIVLDDLDQSDQLMKLAQPSWFGRGSRVIITTRNVEIIPKDNGFLRYEMRIMRPDDALKLFSKLVFKSDAPPKEFHKISANVVNTIERLPLAIKVIGPLFSYKSKQAWERRLKKLKKVVYMDVGKKLMISYEELDNQEKEIFLDIACLFVNKEIEDATYYWEAQQCKPISGIMVLKSMSLIEIVDGNKLWINDVLRDLGRNIVDEKTTFPGKRSRLWSPEEAYSVIHLEKGTEEVVALKLGNLNADCYFNHKQFAGLTNLKFLELTGGSFIKEDFKKVFSELRWFSWEDCPVIFQATNLCFEKLLVLMLSKTKITNDWGGWGEIKAAKELKVLKCTNCHGMRKSPEFFAFRQLERLTFKNCECLEEIDWSVGMLEHLTYFELTECNISRLPDSIGGLKSLSVLKLQLGFLSELPSSIGQLENLNYLYLWCGMLRELPETVGNLKSLVELDISNTRIFKLPESVTKLDGLNILGLRQYRRMRIKISEDK